MTVAPTGFRFCGIAEDPPESPSSTSATSVCARRATSRPIFSMTPPTSSSAAPTCAILVRSVCQGTTGSASSSRSATSPSTRGPSDSEGAERARCAAKLDGQALGTDARQLRSCVEDRDEPDRAFRAERRRHRLLKKRAAGDRRRAVLAGERRYRLLRPRRGPRGGARSSGRRRASPRCRRRPGSSHRDGRTTRPAHRCRAGAA